MMTAIQVKEPAHLRTYRGIRDLILSGDLVPGQPVTIQGLIDQLGSGMTPVREAIRRLTSEGALIFHGNRRVTVPVLTLAQVDELILARCSLEPELARRAAMCISAEDITALEEIDEAIDESMRAGDTRGYMIHNHRFHMALYAPAQAEVIGPIVDALWLRSAPALRVMCTRFGTQNLPDMHMAAIAALRVRDADAAAEAIRADVLQGMENVRAILSDGASLV
ncbi:MAG: GntR family transcriptional regulator [Alphaproteobacteria bacterium]|jgi:DNA-binding GntR family transcriptional regulator|uniref:DNA-binding transcriptional regulator, GntR family n=1 Tax=Celeribacter baekdonensis TaxID=875171 RepID=A0A1G7FI44_9RHOB|nr:GntR family transcriptional regulator [Celeribacter baekdonensis]MBU0643334.1 GntR family transcriptional regulator [Alphaproteobacteria bacterium]MBU1278465.1 GntR family transcriptional regulator [Alphaproteobacteria bacterium]MBU1571897.1 GntR family transcriptional regulator [Alphaproteobacteria bacterium]MBU1828124.1 GntR family transcriptional regulator [Alphaproteobacteria bacterium]MBU2078373.1 GntR family transcriptional regulator [Alphaproteobacteria bacterium]